MVKTSGVLPTCQAQTANFISGSMAFNSQNVFFLQCYYIYIFFSF